MTDEQKQTFDHKDVEDNKLMAALSYIFILCFIPLLLSRESKFAQYHAKQGLVVFVVEVIVMILSNILIFIPILGWLAIMIAYVLLIVGSLAGILKALGGKEWEMPVLAKYAKKLKF